LASFAADMGDGRIIFQVWAKSGDILFYPFEFNKSTFLLQIYYKCLISKSKGERSLFDTHDHEWRNPWYHCHVTPVMTQRLAA